MDIDKLIQDLGVIAKHLEKNEKWFQQPGKKIAEFEKDMGDWNTRYLQTIRDIEKWIKELEKRMEG